MYYIPEKCGRRIQELRKKTNLTQNQMSEALHISVDHLRSIETGRRSASIDLMVALADLFGVSLDYLILGRPFSQSQLRTELRAVISQLEQMENRL